MSTNTDVLKIVKKISETESEDEISEMLKLIKNCKNLTSDEAKKVAKILALKQKSIKDDNILTLIKQVEAKLKPSSSSGSKDKDRPKSSTSGSKDKDRSKSLSSKQKDKPESSSSGSKEKDGSKPSSTSGSKEKEKSTSSSSKDKDGPKSSTSKDKDRPKSSTSKDKDKPKSSSSGSKEKDTSNFSSKSPDKHNSKKPSKPEKALEKSKSGSDKSSSGSQIPASNPNAEWKPSAPLPERKSNGVLIFKDFADFQPNRTPKEVLQAGSFGGTYFRPIFSSVTKQKYGSEVWKELPPDWIEGLNVKIQVASPLYDEKVNRYKAKCGGSLQMWEESGWISPQDPYGWFQWYCRFYQGRRTDDDARQVSRWWNCASVNGRWKNNLITKIFKAKAKFDNPKISPVVRQTLLHWGYELAEDDYLKRAKKLSK